MPAIVYGLVGVHRSHRIDSPSVPKRAEAGERPNACVLCHVERSLGWVADRLREWSEKAGTEPERAPVPVEPEIARLLLRGDPIERAIAANALGSDGADASGAAVAPRLGLLLDSLEHDDYPAVRAIAWRSLRALLVTHYPRAAPTLTAFTATDPQAARERTLAAVVARLPADAVQRPGDTSAAPSSASQTRIFIGE
jgi:hypothetical protein